MLEVIRGVAEQTSLWALNDAIDAVRAAEQQRIMTEQVNENIGAIDRVSGEFSGQAQGMARSSDDMSQLATRLKQQVAKFSLFNRTKLVITGPHL